jgi:hypothetical protein
MFPRQLSLQRDEIGGYYVGVKRAGKALIKRILLAGFSSAAKWKKILGKTLGVIMVDEVDTANKQFIDECFARQASAKRPLQLWTLNGNVPQHWVYTDYINRCNIVGKYRHEVPASILADMDKVLKEKNWLYLHFNFRNNPIMGEEEIARTYRIYPVGSYYHTIKIMGERGSPGKMIYVDYMDPQKLIKKIDYRRFPRYGIGADIGASRAMNSYNLSGFDLNFTRGASMDKWTFKQLGYEAKKEKLIAAIKHWQELGCNIEYVSVDSAEANFIKDLQSVFKVVFPNIDVIPSYKATIKERIDMGIILFASGRWEFNDTPEGRDTYDAFRMAKWADGKEGIEREDLNLPHNDKMDSTEYSWTRHMNALMRASKALPEAANEHF